MPIIGSRLLLFGLSFFREKSLRIPENDAIVFLNLEERKNGYDRIGEKIRHDDASDDDGTHHRYLKGANRAQIRWKGLLFLYASVEHVLKFQRMVRSPYQNQKILIRFFLYDRKFHFLSYKKRSSAEDAPAQNTARVLGQLRWISARGFPCARGKEKSDHDTDQRKCDGVFKRKRRRAAGTGSHFSAAFGKRQRGPGAFMRWGTLFLQPDLRRIFAKGVSFATLFVDQTNSVSDRVYRNVGFRAIEDNLDYRFTEGEKK